MNRTIGKVVAVLFLAFALVCSAVSCSNVFEGGLSGTVYEADGKTGYPGVEVYAYGDKDDRDADYESFVNGMGNADSNGNFVPNSKLYVPKVITGGDGGFTISKIVWKTADSKYGKDDDVRKVYLMYYEKDAAKTLPIPGAPASGKGLVKEENPYTIVSGSMNQAVARISLYRNRKTFGGMAGYIATIASGDTFGTTADDSVRLALHYCDLSCATVSGTSVNLEWKPAGEMMNGTTMTFPMNVDIGSGADDIKATHGNFVDLGSGIEFKPLYGGAYPYGVVLFCIERTDSSGTKYSPTIPVYVSSFQRAINLNAAIFTSDKPVLPTITL